MANYSKSKRATVEVSLPVEMIERIHWNSEKLKQTFDYYVQECIDGYWGEYGYGVDS